MSDVITSNLDIWTSTLLSKSSGGRSSNGKQEAYGIKKLRELILELAVRGKLVPQDSDDEPASELLTRTIAERKRLIKEGMMREAKPPAFPVESPDHELPGGWVWTSLYEIGEIAPRNEADDSAEASFVPMQAISEEYCVPVQHEVRLWGEIKSGFTHLREGDVVLAKITPCFQNGKSAVMRGLTNGFGAGTTELHVFRSINASTVPEYVLIYLKSPRFIGDGIPRMTGTAGQKRITRDYFAGNRFPLPPLAEQTRIVAKVDELMALCDQLEQRQTHSIEAHQTLVETLLGTLTRAASPQELTEAWARLANHFDTLFTTEHIVDQLKQTVLQLAVMGKLVRQDLESETAEGLLRRIREERTTLLNDGYPNREESLTQLRKQEAQVLPAGLKPLPPGWAWATLIQLSLLVVDCHNKTAPYVENGIRLVRTTNVRNGQLNFDDPKFVSEATYERWSARAKPVSGDILITREAPMGEVCIIPDGVRVCLGQRMMLIRLVPGTMDTKYLLYSLMAPDLMDRVQDKPVGATVQHLRVGGVETLLTPVPPIAEQRRIVAKVDELAALCGALNTRLRDAAATQIHLADAIVEQAVA
jgi:type I restriction enzyme S subunit